MLITPLLRELGLDPGEQALYLRLRPCSGMSLDALARDWSTTEDELAEIVRPLVGCGLVAWGDPLIVRSPAQALAAGLEVELAAARRALTGLGRVRELVELLPTLPAEDPSVPGPRPLLGETVEEESVEQVLVSWVGRAEGELLWFRPGPWHLYDQGLVAQAVAAAVARGVRSRAVYPARVLVEEPQIVLARAEAGEEVRLVADLPSPLGIVGGVGAMLPEPFGVPRSGLPGHPGNRRVQVRQPALVAALTGYAEEVWERAVSLPGSARDRAAAGRHRLLLEQLVDGAKDEQIARALGLSLRTVRRRIAALMEELAVESRFQAGVEAVRRGWI